MRNFILFVMAVIAIVCVVQIVRNVDTYGGGVVVPTAQPATPVVAPVIYVVELPTNVPTAVVVAPVIVPVDNTQPRVGITPGTTGNHNPERKDTRNP